jgi:hypothetical protein
MLYLVFKFMNEISDIIYIYIERERARACDALVCFQVYE